MTININPQTATQTQPGQQSAIVSQTVQQTADNAQHKSNNSLYDTLQISDNAQLTKRLKSMIDEVPVVDIEHVNTIKQALANGSYSFNDANVAEKMIQSEVEFRN